MPHQCTNCGHAFPDGSKEMLSGCPDCGGNKFQFKPAGISDDQSTTDSATQQPTGQPQPSQRPSDSPPEPEASPDRSGFVSKKPEDPGESPAQSSARSDVVSPGELTAAGTAPPANATDSSGSSAEDPETPTDQPTSSADQPTESTDQPTSSADDHAEQSADQPTESTADSTVDSPADDASGSSLDELRKELNNQFESIRIVSPGQYELNLMELYDREEYIISLREDGRYVIEVPDSWGDPEDA